MTRQRQNLFVLGVHFCKAANKFTRTIMLISNDTRQTDKITIRPFTLQDTIISVANPGFPIEDPLEAPTPYLTMFPNKNSETPGKVWSVGMDAHLRSATGYLKAIHCQLE